MSTVISSATPILCPSHPRSFSLSFNDHRSNHQASFSFTSSNITSIRRKWRAYVAEKECFYPHITSKGNDQENGYPHKTKQPPAANACPLTPLGFLERAATIYGDCTSIIYKNSTYKWCETYTRCIQLATSIASLGITKGDVVSVVAPNIPAMYELHFAVPMANAILNAINLKLDSRTMSILLQHSESKLVFVDYQSSALVLEAMTHFPLSSKQPILVLINEDHEKSSVNQSTTFYDTYENMVRREPGFVCDQPDSEWDPITLNYTSGTTSSPKGVLHSHRARFLLTMDAVLEWELPKQSIYLWTLPMFHANGWNYTWGTAVVGATNVCLRAADANSIYDAINRYKVTHMCGAPAILNMLSNFQHVKPLETPVHILTAGAPPPPAVLTRAESLGFIVSHGYGLTETGGPVVTCTWKSQWNSLPTPERAEKKSRQGVRNPGFTAMDVVDAESGVSVKHDGSMMGEVVLRGGGVMLGYLKDPEGTLNCMKNGWLYTGDVGVIDPDGYLEIKDRSKDVIICGGENISSVEVESVLYTHPAVNEAAVVARPDKFWGETPCAFVSLKEGISPKPSEKEIREFCKTRLPLYMVPRTVVLKEELPKTSTGKIQKFLLRDMAKSLKLTLLGKK